MRSNHSVQAAPAPDHIAHERWPPERCQFWAAVGIWHIRTLAGGRRGGHSANFHRSLVHADQAFKRRRRFRFTQHSWNRAFSERSQAPSTGIYSDKHYFSSITPPELTWRNTACLGRPTSVQAWRWPQLRWASHCRTSSSPTTGGASASSALITRSVRRPPVAVRSRSFRRAPGPVTQGWHRVEQAH